MKCYLLIPFFCNVPNKVIERADYICVTFIRIAIFHWYTVYESIKDSKLIENYPGVDLTNLNICTLHGTLSSIMLEQYARCCI